MAKHKVYECPSCNWKCSDKMDDDGNEFEACDDDLNHVDCGPVISKMLESMGEKYAEPTTPAQ